MLFGGIGGIATQERCHRWSREWTLKITGSKWLEPPGACPLIIAHRGDVSNAPENTLAAMEKAWRAGADGVEMDVRLTKDERLIAIHDRTLNRTTNGRGMVDHYTLDQLRQLDAGSWFSPAFAGEPPPTLDQVFELLPKDYLVNVEMKVVIKGMKLIARRVAETVARHQRWDSTLVASFNPVALCHLRKMEPRLARGYIYSKSHPYPIRARWLSPLADAHWYDPAQRTYNANTHRKFRRAGRRLLAWSTDFENDLAKAAQAGVDGVVTDHLEMMVRQKTALTGMTGRNGEHQGIRLVPAGSPALSSRSPH